jgi:hypothetical protein
MRHLLILAIFAVIAYASPLRIYQRSLAKHERIASAAEPLPFNQVRVGDGSARNKCLICSNSCNNIYNET